MLGAEGRAEEAAAALLDWGFAAGAGARPVGRLLTPDEVAEERGGGGPAADLVVAQVSAAGRALDDVLTTTRTLSPRWWALLGSVVVLTTLVSLRRNRGRGRAGRYPAR